MEQQRCSQVDFARMIGIAPATLSGIFTGRTQPTLTTAKAIHERFPDISINWLVFGEGDMHEATVHPTHDNGMDTHSAQNTDTPTADTPPTGQHTAQIPLSEGTILPAKDFYKKERKISEIRVFFDDGTYEVYNTFQ